MTKLALRKTWSFTLAIIAIMTLAGTASAQKGKKPGGDPPPPPRHCPASTIDSISCPWQV